MQDIEKKPEEAIRISEPIGETGRDSNASTLTPRPASQSAVVQATQQRSRREQTNVTAVSTESAKASAARRTVALMFLSFVVGSLCAVVLTPRPARFGTTLQLVAAQVTGFPFLLAVIQPAIFGGVSLLALKHIREIAPVVEALIGAIGRSIPRLLAALLILAFVAYAMHDATKAFEKMIESIMEARLIDTLTSDHAEARAAAVEGLTKSGLFKPVEAVGIETSLAMHDPSPEVRAVATRGLQNLTENSDPAVQTAARAGLDRETVESELRARDLLREISGAEAYVAEHSPDGDERAFQIYTDVLDHLSAQARTHIDPDLLASAESARQRGWAQAAVPLYYRIFELYSVH